MIIWQEEHHKIKQQYKNNAIHINCKTWGGLEVQGLKVQEFCLEELNGR